MIAVIFELEPNHGESDTYFDLAADLRPLLEEIDGFISIERFQSLLHEERYLSLSFWRDEEAVSLWRDQIFHKEAQRRGRKEIFKDYRLRVAHVCRDYGLNERAEAPVGSVYDGQSGGASR